MVVDIGPCTSFVIINYKDVALGMMKENRKPLLGYGTEHNGDGPVGTLWEKIVVLFMLDCGKGFHFQQVGLFLLLYVVTGDTVWELLKEVLMERYGGIFLDIMIT